jgi:hypothetical protein
VVSLHETFLFRPLLPYPALRVSRRNASLSSALSMTPGASDRPIVNGSRVRRRHSPPGKVAHVLAVDIAGFPVRGPPPRSSRCVTAWMAVTDRWVGLIRSCFRSLESELRCDRWRNYVVSAGESECSGSLRRFDQVHPPLVRVFARSLQQPCTKCRWSGS